MKPQFKLEKIYLDLSKLSEEQIKTLPKILENAGESVGFHTSIRLNSGKLKDDFVLYFNSSFKEWCLWNNIFKNNTKTELTYSQFLDMIGESEEVLQVENKISIKEITELCNEYNRSDLKISNLKRDLEYKKSWNEESFAIQEIKQQISILQKIKETAQSKLQEIGIVF